MTPFEWIMVVVCLIAIVGGFIALHLLRQIRDATERNRGFLKAMWAIADAQSGKAKNEKRDTVAEDDA